MLVETVRSHGGTGQAFVSSTVPGAMRGDHWHLRKIERFMVVRGEAEIALRRLFHDDVVTFRVSGSEPGFVDMPTMWAHNIRNVGRGRRRDRVLGRPAARPRQPRSVPVASRAHGGAAA